MQNHNTTGDVIDGYEVIAIYKKLYVLAQNKNPEAVLPYAVWHIDQAGEVCFGSYYKRLEDAERHFAELSFNWSIE